VEAGNGPFLHRRDTDFQLKPNTPKGGSPQKSTEDPPVGGLDDSDRFQNLFPTKQKNPLEISSSHTSREDEDIIHRQYQIHSHNSSPRLAKREAELLMEEEEKLLLEEERKRKQEDSMNVKLGTPTSYDTREWPMTPPPLSEDDNEGQSSTTSDVKMQDNPYEGLVIKTGLATESSI